LGDDVTNGSFITIRACNSWQKRCMTLIFVKAVLHLELWIFGKQAQSPPKCLSMLL